MSYTGTGNAADTFGHGLNRRSDFVIGQLLLPAGAPVKVVYHSSLGDRRGIWLSTSGASIDETQTGNGFYSVSGDGTTLTCVSGTTNASNVNSNSNPHVAYCWHAVPGYSAFGSYRGNGEASPNSPFVYLGFRPAFLLIKCSSAGTGGVHNWWIHDTTRAVNNPSSKPLAANVAQEEYNFSGALIDLDSNGFKLQGGPDQMNGNNDYIYAAFAENPFGGNNVSPANAR